MTSARRRRSPMVQPQLPLSCTPEEEAPRPPADWQLDEDTRRIGRQGVAAARALLGEASRVDRADDRGDRGDRAGDRGDRGGRGGRASDRQVRGRGRAGRAGRAA